MLQSVFQRVLCLALLGCLSCAQAQSAFPLTELKAGQEGYAITAVAGNTLARFAVRVLDTVVGEHGSPLVLVRVSGDVIDEAGGIAAGMSGSPVFLGERILGAIAYGFPGSDSRLGLVTPLEVMQRGDGQTSLQTLSARFFPAPTWALGLAAQAKPLATPLLFSGLHPKLAPRLFERFERLGFAPMLAQNTSTQTTNQTQRPAYTLVPGAPLSVALVAGDVDIAAFGTVTWVSGNRFLAFGHPFLGDARARYLAQPAYVSALVRNRDVPFKLAETSGKPFGMVLQDRFDGLGGQSGTLQSWALEVAIKNGKTSRVFKTQLAPVEELLGVLGYLVTGESVYRALGTANAGNAKLTAKIELEGRKPVVYSNETATQNDVALAAGQTLGEALEWIGKNPFATPKIKSIAVAVEVLPFNQWQLQKAEPESRNVKPGQTLNLNLRLQPWRAAPVVRRVQFKIPQTFKGTLRVVVRGAQTPRPKRNEDPRDPYDGMLGFDELLERLTDSIGDNTLIVETDPENAWEKPVVLALETLPAPVAGFARFSLSEASK